MSDNLSDYFDFMNKYRRVLTSPAQRKEFALKVFANMIEDPAVEPAIKKRLVPIVNQHIADGMRRGV